MSEVIEVTTPPQIVGVVEIDQQVISLGSSQVIEVGYVQPGGGGSGGGGSDKFFEQPFPSAVTSVIVTHNLGKFPAVSVTDSSNRVIIGDVVYTDTNSLVVSFTTAESGIVYCN
jgi:hypothetical protein